jgi:hypothetical protein
MASSSLEPLPTSRVIIDGRLAATVEECLPLVNVAPFCMCGSLANPTVAAARPARPSAC